MARSGLSLGAALFLWLLLGVAAFAQTQTSDVFDRWSTFASAVQEGIEEGTSSNAIFDDYRSRVVEFRADFERLRGRNAERIAVLRQQIAALGAPPEGENAPPEPVDVAARRAELTDELSALLAPVQRAEAEFVRADALVDQIDAVLRKRTTRRLLSASETPLDPRRWGMVWRDLGEAAAGLWQENAQVRSARSISQWVLTLPVAALLAVLGLLLMLRGRFWSLRIVSRLRTLGARGFGIWRFLVSLLRIALPFTGITLLVSAIGFADIFGNRGDDVLVTFALLCGIMLGYRWVADRVFAKDEDEVLIPLKEAARRGARFHVSLLTFILAVGELMVAVLNSGGADQSSEALLRFPFLVLAAFPLFRLGQLLRTCKDSKDKEDTAEPRGTSLLRIVGWLGLGAMLVAIVAPVLAAAGYFEASRALFTPYVLTLVLLGLVMALQRFAADVYGAFTRQGEHARDALLPVLVGMALLVLVSPLIALVWGARVTDLTEIWTAIGRGFAIGETRISPTNFLTFAVIFTIGYMITRLLQSALRTNVLPKTRMDIGGQNAVVSGLGYIGIFLAALAAITGAGIDLSSLAIVAGALSVGIGFGLQNIVSNFVSGIILLIERPISEGDWIEVSGGQMGYVRDISVRSTRIETFDRTDVIVPNADLVSGTVTNYTRGNTVGRIIVPVGVAYGTDTKKVDTILREIAEAQPMALATPPPNVYFVGFGADSLNFEIRCFLRDVNWMMVVTNDINHAIVARFAQEGIEIPFAQRDVWLRNPETLAAAPPPQKESDA